MKWKERMSAPSPADKYWIKTTYKGLNECLLINSKTGSCLPNCVGYTWGRAYEASGVRSRLSRGNAENWWAYNDGYERGQTPRKGAIACWRKGKAGDASDGAGHVAFVERVASNGVDFTSSNSGYGGTRFWIQNHKKTNNYNVGKNYVFQGFIYLPGIEFDSEPNSTPTPTPSTLKFKIGDRVIINGTLYGNADGGNPGMAVSNRETIITRAIAGKAYPYNTTGDLGWMKESSITLKNQSISTKRTHTVKKGETVSGICQRYYGKSTRAKWDEVKNANHLNSKYTIYPGQVLIIP